MPNYSRNVGGISTRASDYLVRKSNAETLLSKLIGNSFFGDGVKFCAIGKPHKWWCLENKLNESFGTH